MKRFIVIILSQVLGNIFEDGTLYTTVMKLIRRTFNIIEPNRVEVVI